MSLADEQIAQLPKPRSPRLHALWRKIFGSEPPIGTKREFIARLLAYALQERAHGALPRSVAKQLADHVPRCDGEPAPPPIATPSADLRPGASLIRTWRGRTHEVTVVDRGFAYRGDHYRSLTEIARVITGTHWSGPRFFGLKRGQRSAAKEAS
jgi:hypothetical protein